MNLMSAFAVLVNGANFGPGTAGRGDWDVMVIVGP